MQETEYIQKEVEHFANLADLWWDPEGPLATLHIINIPRLEFIKQHDKLSNRSVLDIGCGAGILTESLAKEGAMVTGIDAGQQVINAAIEHATASKLDITYIHSTGEEFAETCNEQFDVITCMELLEHVPNPESLIAACKKLIKPGGKLFFSTIHRNPKSFLYAIVAAEYIFKLLPKNTHQYSNFIRPSELDNALRNQQLKLLHLSGISFNPLFKHAKLSTNVQVNYIAYASNES